MPIIQTRDFMRVVDAGNLEVAIAEVRSELNTFLATFSNPCNVLGIDYHTGQWTKYGERMVHRVSVVYLETP